MVEHDHPFSRDPATVSDFNIEGPPLTDEMVVRAIADLGRPLPSSYLELTGRCNGRYLQDSSVATSRSNSWARDHVSIRSIFGIPAVGEQGQFGTGSGVKPGVIFKTLVDQIERDVANLTSVFVGKGKQYIQENQPQAIGEAIATWLTTHHAQR